MATYYCKKCGQNFKQNSQLKTHHKLNACDNDLLTKLDNLTKKIMGNSGGNKIIKIPIKKKKNSDNKSGDNKNDGLLRVASMFSGCGGLDYVFHTDKRFKVVYANDFDKDSCVTYENYYKFKPECEDIKNLKIVPECDIMTGGFPCQGFSMANQYRDESDSRNVLYKELVRLLKLRKPKYFIFENVKGILNLGGYANSVDKKNKCGKIFKMIVAELEEVGYVVHTKLFKMKWYNIPQNRERVIFIGIRKNISASIKFMWPNETQVVTKTLKDAIGDLPLAYKEDIQHVGTKHKVKITGYMGNRKLDWDSVAPTITGRGGGTGGPVINVHPAGTRRMTVREYARIQTFPDDFKFHGSISSMYRQIGNAVPPDFSKIVGEIVAGLDKQLS